MLRLHDCEELEALSLESFIWLRSLDVKGCSSLTTVTGFHKLKDLSYLCFESDSVQVIATPMSLKGSRNLDGGCLTLSKPGRAKMLRHHLERLNKMDQNLWGGCGKIARSEVCIDASRWVEEFPKITSLYSLRIVRICECEITKLPDFGWQPSLEELFIEGCEKLVDVSCLGNLAGIRTFEVTNCAAAYMFPDFRRLVTLERLIVVSCGVVRLPGLNCLVKLRELICKNCIKLQLPDLGALTKLEVLDVSGCAEIPVVVCVECMVDLLQLRLLRPTTAPDIDVAEVPMLLRLPCVNCLAWLRELICKRCINLQPDVDLSALTKLEVLDVSGCTEISSLAGVERMVDLQELRLSGCAKLANIPDVAKLRKLDVLYLDGCEEVISLEPLKALLMSERDLRELEFGITGSPWLSIQAYVDWIRDWSTGNSRFRYRRVLLALVITQTIPPSSQQGSAQSCTTGSTAWNLETARLVMERAADVAFIEALVTSGKYWLEPVIHLMTALCWGLDGSLDLVKADWIGKCNGLDELTNNMQDSYGSCCEVRWNLNYVSIVAAVAATGRDHWYQVFRCLGKAVLPCFKVETRFETGFILQDQWPIFFTHALDVMLLDHPFFVAGVERLQKILPASNAAPETYPILPDPSLYKVYKGLEAFLRKHPPNEFLNLVPPLGASTRSQRRRHCRRLKMKKISK